jgi:hypothetical protein
MTVVPRLIELKRSVTAVEPFYAAIRPRFLETVHGGARDVGKQ